MPTLAIDCRFGHVPTGLGRYTRGLVPPLLTELDPGRCVILVRSAREPWLDRLPSGVRVAEAPWPHYSIAEQLRLPRFLSSLGVSAFFALHFNVPYACPVPFAATVHDLILHAYPNRAGFAKAAAYRLLMRRTIGRARRLFTVSAFVAGEIAATYGARAAARVAVVHPGVDALFCPLDAAASGAASAEHGIDRPYFLYVGNAKQHKNVQLLIDAFARAGDTGRVLVLVTGGPEASALRLPPGVRLLTGVADDDLPALYSAAEALVTASLYEGFCLPVAEAGACGCPVIASDRTAIPEAAPPGALLLPPTVDAFAQAFRMPPPRPAAIDARFRWKDAAQRTASLLRESLPI